MGVIPRLVKRLGKELISFTTGKRINSLSFLKTLSGIDMHMFFYTTNFNSRNVSTESLRYFYKRSGGNIHCDVIIYTKEELKISQMSTN